MQLRKIILILILFCSLFFIGCSQNDPVFKDTQDHSIQLAQLKGKWVIVNYWAVWCHSCIKEIPELNNFAKSHQNSNIILLGVNYDMLALDDLKHAVEQFKITFPVLINNPSQAWHLGEIGVVPTTFIISPEGKVVKVISGQISEKSLSNILQALQAIKNV